jgi:dTMP kinase
VSFLLAVEGADGAGKATAAENICQIFSDRGVKATIISFPRYRETVGGFALGEFLSGRMPVPTTPYCAAVLYALDRFESREMIEEAYRSSEIIIFDRYIASNIAYQAAKVAPHDAPSMMRWIISLETQVFTLPIPDLNIYLNTPLEIAMQLIVKKHRRLYTGLSFDEHERDLELQRRVRENYLELVRQECLSPWEIVTTVSAGILRQPVEIASQIVNTVIKHLDRHC